MCQSVGCGQGFLLTAKMLLGGMLLTLPAESAQAQVPQQRPMRKPVMRLPQRLMQNQVAAANFQSMSVSVVNGHRTVAAHKNTQKIEIEDDNGQNIKMKVTETVEGKPVTKEYQAENLEALKKLSPDAAKLFEELTSPPAPNVAGPGFPAFGPPPGLGIPFGLVDTGPKVSNAQKEIETAIEKIEASRKRLEKLTGEKVDPQVLESILDELEQAQKILFAASAALK